MSLTNDLTGKYVMALVNGLIKMNFYGDDSITKSFLIAELFQQSKLDATVQSEFVESLSKVLISAAQSNAELDVFTQLMKDNGMNDEQATGAEQIWKKESSKIHDRLVSNSSFAAPSPLTTASSTGIEWRVDVTAHSRFAGELNQPVAIVQLKNNASSSSLTSTNAASTLLNSSNNNSSTSLLSNASSLTSTSSVVQFELDRSKAAYVLAELNKIEQLITSRQ